MSYLHIRNLYADQTIMLFRECYALEKVHGTSAHVAWDKGLRLHSGGAAHADFAALFDVADLDGRFAALGHSDVTVYGEAYGGKMQKMGLTYGKALRFVAFDVKIGRCWLAVPQADDVATKLGFEFVPYEKCSTDIDALDAQRDAPSVVAVRRGIEVERPREGIVLRPLVEVTLNNGERVIAKHKGEAFSETATPREIRADATTLAEADAIAAEWVTPMRLAHVLDKLPAGLAALGIERTGEVIRAMHEDVRREAGEEVEWSREAAKAVGARAAKLFKASLAETLRLPANEGS